MILVELSRQHITHNLMLFMPVAMTTIKHTSNPSCSLIEGFSSSVYRKQEHVHNKQSVMDARKFTL